MSTRDHKSCEISKLLDFVLTYSTFPPLLLYTDKYWLVTVSNPFLNSRDATRRKTSAESSVLVNWSRLCCAATNGSFGRQEESELFVFIVNRWTEKCTFFKRSFLPARWRSKCFSCCAIYSVCLKTSNGRIASVRPEGHRQRRHPLLRQRRLFRKWPERRSAPCARTTGRARTRIYWSRTRRLPPGRSPPPRRTTRAERVKSSAITS